MKEARISGSFVVLSAVFCLLLSAGWAAACSVENTNTTNTYATISDALAAANSKDTLSVSGTCNENVTVTKAGITLDGSGSAVIDATTATPTSPVITVSAQNVSIMNFASIQGGTTGIKMFSSASAIIGNNTIPGAGNANASHGIMVSNCASAYIIGNTITGFPNAGISVRDNASANIGFIKDSETTATPNTIGGSSGSGNGIGIQVLRSSSARIVGNTIEGNSGNGIEVDKVSQADIANNIIEANSLNGIYVAGNSGVNLGGGSSDSMFDWPNYTPNGAANKNTKYAVACDTGAYVSGYLGSLAGAKTPSTSFAGTCVNALVSTRTVVGDWNVTGSSGLNHPPTTVTFYSDGTGIAAVSSSGTASFTWTLTWKSAVCNLKLTFSATDIASGTVTWTDLNDATYNFTETIKTGKRSLTLARQL